MTHFEYVECPRWTQKHGTAHYTPTPEQEAFIREAVAGGRFATAGDAAREALRQRELRERRRKELLVGLDTAKSSLARREDRRLTK